MRFAAVSALALLAAVPAGADTLVPVPAVPGADYTFVYSINDKNVIAGAFYDGSGTAHGFFGTLDGKYTTFDYQSGGTAARGIDEKGDVVGYSNFQGAAHCAIVPFQRGRKGHIRTITLRKSPLQGQIGNGRGGVFAGDYCSKGKVLAYDEAKGKLKDKLKIAVKSPSIQAHGLNGSGTVVGSFDDAGTGAGSGFLLKGGVTSVVRYPDQAEVDTYLQAVNDSGIATGHWDAGDFEWRAFTFDTATSTFATIAVPGASFTQAFGINSAGLIAIDSGSGPFIFCPTGAECPGGGIPVERRRIHLPPGRLLNYDGRTDAPREARAHPGLPDADGNR